MRRDETEGLVESSRKVISVRKEWGLSGGSRAESGVRKAILGSINVVVFLKDRRLHSRMTVRESVGMTVCRWEIIKVEICWSPMG